MSLFGHKIWTYAICHMHELSFFKCKNTHDISISYSYMSICFINECVCHWGDLEYLHHVQPRKNPKVPWNQKMMISKQNQRECLLRSHFRFQIWSS